MDRPNGEWHPDPSGRHQYRWWDGAAWSEHVADKGVTATDTYDGPQLPPAPSKPTVPSSSGHAIDVAKSSVPTGVPAEFSDAVKVCFSKYAQFKGRATRQEFWWFVLFLALGTGVVMIGALVLLTVLELATAHPFFDDSRFGVFVLVLWFIFVLSPLLAVAARRLHDSGWSGWWLLLTFVPYVVWVLIVPLAMPSKPTDNAYGPPPSPVNPQRPPSPQETDENGANFSLGDTEVPVSGQADSSLTLSWAANKLAALPRRALAVLVVAAVLIVTADLFWRNHTLDAVVTAVEQSESAMIAAGSEIFVVVENLTSESQLDESRAEIQQIAYEAEISVREAEAILAEAFIPWWHRQINRSRATYFEHSGAWITRYSATIKDADAYFEPTPVINATFTTTCRAHRNAVPLFDFVDLEARIEQICSGIQELL